MKNKKLLAIIGLAIVALGAGFFIYRDINKEVSDTTIEVTDNTLDTSDVQAVEEGVTPSAPKAPTLVRSTEFKNTLSPEAKTIILTSLASVTKTIEKNSTDIDAWIMLGVYRKNLGDYEGAREAWDYAKILAPKDVVPYNNLADLYHYYIKDLKKSEENWKKAIAVKNDYVLAYVGLVDLYKYSMTDKKGEIPAVLKDGIAKNPDAVDLMVMLAHHYQDAGNPTEAKKAFGEAITVAERLGNTEFVARLKGELEAVK
jgi:tetratricopeptide (TPR) repeat protein